MMEQVKDQKNLIYIILLMEKKLEKQFLMEIENVYRRK